MKILFVSMIPFEYNNSAVIQNKGLISGLKELGHNIDIVTLVPDEDYIAYDENMNDVKEFYDNHFKISMASNYYLIMPRKNSNISLIKRNLRVKILFRSFIKKMYKSVNVFDTMKLNISEVDKLNVDMSVYDLVISSSDPKSSHLLAMKLLKENSSKKIKWIQYWGDPMYLDITRKERLNGFLVKYHEKKLISSATSVFYVSPLTLIEQKKIYAKYASKMYFANQSALISRMQHDNSRMEANSKVFLKFGYFGSYFSEYRDIQPLYDTFLGIKEHLVIAGQTDVNLDEKQNILISGVLSSEETHRQEDLCDVLICLCNSSGTQIPGKIYYISSFQKPIIVIIDGEHKKKLLEYFNSFNRYIVCENNVEQISNAIAVATNQVAEKKQFALTEMLLPTFLAERLIDSIK